MPVNDNDPASPAEPAGLSDEHGRAALLLIESLIHGLCEKATLSAREAADIAERAAAILTEQMAELANGAVTTPRSHDLLAAIAKSLRIDDSGAPIMPTP